MSKKIFLIEDEMMLREMYELILDQRGYVVDSVKDGQEALDKLGKGKPDYGVILLDIMLPKVNGIDVLKEIKKDDSPIKDIPVYLLTNLGQEGIINEAFKIGAEGYIVKSQNLPAEVADKIDAFFEKRNKGSETSKD